ncbi:MAG TPA: glutathione peroxidase [Pseudomonas sp.]|nr:glutathione peroxidase [Pseudomonas sp.]
MTDLLQIPVTAIDGRETRLAEYDARALLVVNTASRCGFTPQYEGLERLWQHYKDRGLVVMGFPCNQFGAQEPGEEGEIASFCSLTFGVSFPLFRKLEVNGPGAHPLFAELKRRAPGLLGSQRIKWNFTKFLINADGSKVERFAPTTKPEALRAAVENLLR